MTSATTPILWRFVRIGLIVTGTGERSFLPYLFRPLTGTGHCTFEVIRQIGQRSPITSPKKILKMVGTGQVIPDRDEVEIGLEARKYFQGGPDRYVIVIDDLEYSRLSQLQMVFERYRKALDVMLKPFGLDRRASVHFLANMLEAYYFADVSAVNIVLKTALTDYSGDVEHIRHPKGNLKAIFADFDERAHGEEIVKKLDLDRILSRPETCASLRSLIAWCWRAVGESVSSRFELHQGIYSLTTGRQIGTISA